MDELRSSWRYLPALAASGCLVIALAGCGSVGPNLVRNGRGVYNDAITQTNDEQILESIVNGRYAESTSMLAVASVAASVTIAGTASANFGLGPDDSFIGNLVPLGVGAVYEENPTITYLPVAGKDFVVRLLTPLPLDVCVLLIRSVDGVDFAFTLFVKGINGVRSPTFVEDPSRIDTRFARIGQLFDTLSQAGHMTWLLDPETKGLEVLFSLEAPQRSNVLELFALLGLDAPAEHATDVTVPVLQSVGQSRNELRIDTRSLHELMLIAQAAIDIPEKDLRGGFAKTFAPLGEVGQGIRIQRAQQAPEDASVVIARGDWQY